MSISAKEKAGKWRTPVLY